MKMKGEPPSLKRLLLPQGSDINHQSRLEPIYDIEDLEAVPKTEKEAEEVVLDSEFSDHEQDAGLSRQLKRILGKS